MRARPRSRLAALALALAACAPARDEGPVPLSVAPDRGTPDGAVDVEITGRGLAPAVATDYGDGARSAVSAAFAARLAPVGGGADVPLEAVTPTARASLTARVPAGIGTGAYDLVVVAPDGREGRLRDAFRVVTAAENVASFRFGPVAAQAAGIPFRVVVTAVDGAGRTVEGFAGTVTLADDTGTASPAALGPFAGGRATALVTVPALAAADRLSVRDAAGRAGLSEVFAVLPGPPVALVFAAAPPAAAGGCAGPFVLEVRDALGHPAPVAAPLAVRLDVAPPGGAVFHPGAGCAAPAATLSLAAGASGASFHVRAVAPGAVVLRAVAESLPSAEQEVTFAP